MPTLAYYGFNKDMIEVYKPRAVEDITEESPKPPRVYGTVRRYDTTRNPYNSEPVYRHGKRCFLRLMPNQEKED